MTAIERLIQGNREYLANSDAAPRERLATEGQHPYAVIITCSDSRDIPEVLFNAAIGELFVIRVAGNVLADHELGSVEYAVEHLGCRLVVMLGHTGCGAIEAALKRQGGGHISSIVGDILKAIGAEKDADKACRLNVARGVSIIREGVPEADVRGAIYDIRSGKVEWLDEI